MNDYWNTINYIPHSGKYDNEKIPIQTSLNSLFLAKEKMQQYSNDIQKTKRGYGKLSDDALTYRVLLFNLYFIFWILHYAVIFKERWLSGRRRQTRNLLNRFFCSGGSNPPLSAIFL